MAKDKQISVVYLGVDDVTPYENNARVNDKAVDAVARSIDEYGFKNPILIDKDNVIIAGHTRLKAAQKLGIKSVPCIYADDLTPQQIKAFRIADNKTGEIADWDFDMLEQELHALLNGGYDIDSIGFNQKELDEIIAKTVEDMDYYLDLRNGDSAGNVAGVDIPETEENEIIPQKLSDKFIIPPFDIFDAKSRQWLERKKLWNKLINDKAQARENAKAYSNKQTNDKSKYKHNGTMTSETSILDATLSEIICKWFLPKGENVCCDCFAGDTVFGFVSSYLNNKFIGIELRQEQADFNNEHTNEKATYICDDGRNILNHIKENSVDLLFSCPPYYDLEVYSDNENDASNQETYEEFYAILDTAFTNAIKCLKNNRFAVIVCGDIRNKKTGAYYNFPNDIINTFKRNGLILYNNIKLLTPYGNAQIRCGRYMKNRKTAHIYQDVLVFYKGDQKAINEIFGEVEVAEIESEDMELQ